MILIVLCFRVLLVVMGLGMTLVCIDKLHDYVQEHYKQARSLYRGLSLLSALLHVLVYKELNPFHLLYSTGTALLYTRLADQLHSLEMQSMLVNLTLTGVNHFCWFKFFLSPGRSDDYGVEVVTACYILLVWLVPVMYLAACTTDAAHLPNTTFDGTTLIIIGGL